ncbi:MAG TPA: thioredoxin family protein [Candidatus Syntrophosphaera sp.]|nr:thioredoxin family protein [Candidatus Syntrophosphaera sp.]
MIIKILGTGCPKCKKLEANALLAMEQSGIEATVEKVTDLNAIMNFGVMMTPALVIGEKVVSSGKVLSPEEIKAIIRKGV